jgi:hypothetical protein
MREERLVEDRLRAEYVNLLPAMKRIQVSMETEVRYLLLPIILELDGHEQIIVRARLKDCESAVASLRRRQNGSAFDAERSERYSLTALRDLVGLRVMTFPGRRFRDAHRVIRRRIADWTADPIPAIDRPGPPLGRKYYGRWNPNDSIRSEVQVVPLLISLFWEVEHSAIYKPTTGTREIAVSFPMRGHTAAVVSALQHFEAEFDRQLGTSLDEL